MLKNEILKLTELRNHPKYSKLEFKKEDDAFDFIEKLPTIQKIFIAQNLLKQMISIKDLFLDNKKNMIKKIDSMCYKYFKNIISIKQIYDYCNENKPEKISNYILLKDEEADDALHWFEEGQKNFITNFLFELRNDNNLMLKIIKEIDIKYYDQLGYFLTHFLYENTTSSNFTQDELILMLYLVMEETIFNKFPKNFSQDFLIKLHKEKNNFFLFFFMKNLTKKAEIRNYINNIINDLILDLEDINSKLTVNISTILEETKNQIQDNNDDLRRKKTIFNLKKDNSDFIPIKGKEKIDLQKSSKNFNNRTKSMIPLNMLISPNDQKEEELKNENINYTKYKSSNNLENYEDNDMDIFSFFIENIFNQVELSKIMKNINKTEENKSEIEEAFWEFLLLIKNEFLKENNKEIFSSEMVVEFLVDHKEKIGKNEEEKDKKMDLMYKNNYFIIINFIEKLFEKILQSLNSLPYTIKCIFFFLDKLISKKYSEKNNITSYQLIILKLKFFIEGFIIPVLSNPLYNGCVSNAVISNTTLENLKLISLIVEKFLSGNLFKIFNDNSDPYMTIFNKFIVNQMRNFFNIGLEIDKNIKNKFEPPNVVMQLIEFNELNDLNIINDVNGRNINYDFFIFNNQESIQYQSVCFSYSDLLMFINTVNKQNIRDYIEKQNKIKSDFYLVFKYRNYFNEKYKKNVSENKIEFLFISNLKYKETFLNNIKAVTEEHFDNYFKYEKNNSEVNEELLLFKKCLIEVMIFINKINKENFNSFIKGKNKLILNTNSLVNKYFKQQKFNKYKNTIFEKDINDNKFVHKDINNNLEKYLMKSCLSCNLMEDADFLEEIFPKMINSMKYELGNSTDYERIIFCITFLQINIKNLPSECSKNNYSKLFLDIIEDILNLLRSLQNNILNQFYLKIREGEKLNLIISKYSSEIKSMEKNYTINYIFNKLTPNNPLEEQNNPEKIKNISHSAIVPGYAPNLKSQGKSIISFINNFEDFRENAEEIDEIILYEKKKEIPEILKKYFKEISNLVKKEKIMKKYQNKEYIMSICYDLENYILLKLHKKIFPLYPSKSDEFIYNKCQRLSFIKPENIIANQKMINKNLLLKATEYINNIDKRHTPVDKINMFGKAFQILQNSMTFSSGKSDLGVDDILPFLIYVMIKAKPKMINSNYIFCKNYINPELDKKEFGFLLMQIGVVIRIICNMKYNELKGVTEEQFGIDEELPPGLIDNKKKESNKIDNNEIKA